MNILIICGEVSANLYAVSLAKSCSKVGHQVYSFGDHNLAKVSTQLLSIDSTSHSVGYGKSSHKKILLSNIRSALQESTIVFDRIVIVDFPGYNFQISKFITPLKVPIITFITPNFWMWNQKKLGQRLADYSHRIIPIFEKEHAFYSRFNPESTHYLGHPLTLSHSSSYHVSSNEPYIGLFPGSRRSEINDHLPVFCQLISQIASLKASFSIFCSQIQLHPQIQTILDANNLGSIPIKSDIEPITFAITAPGTNTLRLALQSIPMIIIGQLRPLEYYLAKYIYRVKLPYIGLPNIIMDNAICPEYIQPSMKTTPIAHDLIQLLNDQEKIESMLDQFKIIREKITAPSDYWDQIAAIISE